MSLGGVIKVVEKDHCHISVRCVSVCVLVTGNGA